MKRLRNAVAYMALAGMVAGLGPAFAQEHHEQGGHEQGHEQGHEHGGPGGHPEWHRGAHISHDDWNRGQHVDYHAHHLRAPPRGYEWRQVDGNYVLAAVATGVIASILLANH